MLMRGTHTMGKRRNTSKGKLASGLLGCAVASGLAAASLGGVPTASATCIGISGININLGGGGGCFTTVGSFALGLGPNTIATSAGFLTSAIAIGLGNEPSEITQATSFGLFSFAWAGGPDTLAETNGNANLAVVQGENAQTVIGAGTAFDNVNIGINVGNGFDTASGLHRRPLHQLGRYFWSGQHRGQLFRRLRSRWNRMYSRGM